MKIRNGFVSNSSTSSFTCEICGESYTGWDASPYDSAYDCSICENEHIMCNSHIKNSDSDNVVMVDGCEHEFDRELNKFCPECESPAFTESDGVEISEKNCPICQFEDYSEADMVSYLEKTRNIEKDIVFAEVKKVNKRRKKLYDSEYITYVCSKFSLTDDLLIEEIKSKFSTYKAYRKFLYGIHG